MILHVALIAEFQCTEDIYRKATELPFLSVMRELDDEGSFGYQDVAIGDVMDGTYKSTLWRLRCDWHEDDWHEADTEKMEAFLVKLAELGATGAVMAYQYVNAVSPEIKLWNLGLTPVELSLNELDPVVRDLLKKENLYDALGALKSEAQ